MSHGLSWSLTPAPLAVCICVCLWGLQLLRKFEQQRVSLLREYTNFDLDSPYELAMYYVRQVRGHHHFPEQRVTIASRSGWSVAFCCDWGFLCRRSRCPCDRLLLPRLCCSGVGRAVLAFAPVHPPAQLPRALQPRTHGRYGTNQSITKRIASILSLPTNHHHHTHFT